ncbi:MAG TPA: phosphate transport system regulatory protein PhoU, partial [Rhodobacteraceae bacterium]|nr:phosphate transport system regulatory protein PhoU [Paracoccaceae bacterium]
ERDVERAQTVRAGDKVVDALEEAINDQCARLIALRAPTAVDLRIVLSVMKVGGNLERIGDYAKNMA